MGNNKYLFIGITIIVSILLSACSANEEVIKIHSKDSLRTLFIQKVEGNSSSEEMTKIVKDKDKIEKILSKIEGLKVEDSNSQFAFDELKSQNTYTFSFFDSEKFESGKEVPYAFSVLNDGTFIFTHKDVGLIKTPRMTIAKHKDLLNEMKQLLEINF
ncbi:hypothetical protein [Neobacillus drentensis]|uniref:hypothetical protein n=1 Tax=Neobacillus drentensis TaxID=220684 RepID=UPI00300127AA